MKSELNYCDHDPNRFQDKETRAQKKSRLKGVIRDGKLLAQLRRKWKNDVIYINKKVDFLS